MDRSDIRIVIEDHLWPLQVFLGLSDWRIGYNFERLHGRIAEVDIVPDYQRATISFEVDYPGDDIDILDTIFHELAHVLISKFKVAGDIIRDATLSDRVRYRAWDHAEEQTVCRLEYLWRNHLRPSYLEEYTRPS